MTTFTHDPKRKPYRSEIYTETELHFARCCNLPPATCRRILKLRAKDLDAKAKAKA